MTADYRTTELTTRPQLFLSNIEGDLPDFIEIGTDDLPEEELEPLFDPDQEVRRLTRRSQRKPSDVIEFSDSTESDFARSLDARNIRWRYKPRTFAVEWDDEGNFVDCFTPSFYLPDRRMFIALAAADGRTSNNTGRMVKLLRQQHPKIRIELVVGGNASALLEKVS
jgi:hypothetical protein